MWVLKFHNTGHVMVTTWLPQAQGEVVIMTTWSSASDNQLSPWQSSCFSAPIFSCLVFLPCCYHVFIIGCTSCCHDDNLKCSQWKQSSHHDNLWITVLESLPPVLPCLLLSQSPWPEATQPISLAPCHHEVNYSHLGPIPPFVAITADCIREKMTKGGVSIKTTDYSQMNSEQFEHRIIYYAKLKTS